MIDVIDWAWRWSPVAAMIQKVRCALCKREVPKREAHVSHVAGKGRWYTCHDCTPWMK